MLNNFRKIKVNIDPNCSFCSKYRKMKDNKNSKILIILLPDFYKYYYGLNLASTYKACNKDVTIFYTGHAISFLLKNWKSYDKSKINSEIKNKKMPNYLEMLNLCLELKITFYFCKTALDFLNLYEEDFLESIHIKSAPLYQIIKDINEQTFYIIHLGDCVHQ